MKFELLMQNEENTISSEIVKAFESKPKKAYFFMGNLKDTAAYLQSYIDEATGEEKYKSSAENMNILFFKTDVEEGFEYENVLYVNYLVETYCTELNNK